MDSASSLKVYRRLANISLIETIFLAVGIVVLILLYGLVSHVQNLILENQASGYAGRALACTNILTNNPQVQMSQLPAICKDPNVQPLIVKIVVPGP